MQLIGADNETGKIPTGASCCCSDNGVLAGGDGFCFLMVEFAQLREELQHQSGGDGITHPATPCTPALTKHSVPQDLPWCAVWWFYSEDMSDLQNPDSSIYLPTDIKAP